MSSLLAALADAARENRKDDFDRLERELLSSFDGGFDGMPESIHQSYLEIDRLWPVVPETLVGTDPAVAAASRLRVVRVSLSAADEAWLRQLGTDADRSTSAVLSACLQLIRENPEFESRVAELLRGRPGEG